MDETVARGAMNNGNRLKIGLFGTNCSSGRTITRIPERWSGNWDDNLALALLADEAGIDFLLPIARFKGHGGDTDYQGTTFETLTWASALLAHTKRITIFGTVHAPLSSAYRGEASGYGRSREPRPSGTERRLRMERRRVRHVRDRQTRA